MQKQVAPEDDWNLVGNPSVYLDQLPQPYRFINKCLDLLILAPVFQSINLIEEKKQTTEYEGFLKEVQASSFHDMEGITTLNTVSAVSEAGGLLEKNTLHSVANKVLLGDKFGNIILMDVNKKAVLDKKLMFEVSQPRRILNIQNCTIEWMDTRLTYLTVIARGSPIVKILAFKHNENKIYHLHNLNVCPNLVNPDNLEANVDQSYLELPSECKISFDGLFLTVISFSGEVKLMKMPPIINPMQEEEKVQQPPPQQQQQKPGAKGVVVQQPVVQQISSSNVLGEDKTILKQGIDHLQTQNIELSTILISKIEARKDTKFIDPFQVPQPPSQQDSIPQSKYPLGSQVLDSDGGDSGCLLKKSKFYPNVYFIRTLFCGKSQTDAKSLKEYFITTAIVVAHLNTFDVAVYNFQKPMKENLPLDYSIGYFNKIIAQRKINAKKKPEKTLASLIKTVRQKEEAIEKKNPLPDIQNMKDSMQKPVRQFKMPYQITCTAFQGKEDNYQGLAIGLIDGAVVIIDLILGLERQFLEKHPSEISALSFWDDKVLLSGSIDGRVNINDIEEERDNPRMSKCQNCQDRRIPVASILTSHYGVGVAVDIEGNCRFYDLIRFKKIAKLSSFNQKDGNARFLSESEQCKFRLLPSVAFENSHEAFLAITQTHSVPSQNEVQTISEQDLLIDKKYSDKPQNLKSLTSITKDSDDGVPFCLQRSSLCVFRFEDVLMNVYPNLATQKRKGMTAKEAFLKQDPAKEVVQGVKEMERGPNASNYKYESASYKSLNESKKNVEKSVASGTSNKRSDHHSVNFNLAPQTQDNNLQLDYDIPTLKRLNPELYKEFYKSQKQMKDPQYQSAQNIKERYSYHEARVQRIQKRQAEVSKELSLKNEENQLKTRKQNMRGSSSGVK